MRKLTGLRKYTNITLKRGYTQNKELWHWRKDIINGTVKRRSADIILLDGNPLEGYWNWLKAKVVIKGGKVVVDKRGK